MYISNTCICNAVKKECTISLLSFMGKQQFFSLFNSWKKYLCVMVIDFWRWKLHKILLPILPNAHCTAHNKSWHSEQSNTSVAGWPGWVLKWIALQIHWFHWFTKINGILINLPKLIFTNTERYILNFTYLLLGLIIWSPGSNKLLPCCVRKVLIQQTRWLYFHGVNNDVNLMKI